MAKIRELLSENPISFNELLDLFEAYVSTIAEPLNEAVNLIRDELNYQSGDIFQHICGVSFFSGDMAKHLKRIRAARNAESDATVTVTGGEATSIEDAIRHTGDMISDAAVVFGRLHRRAGDDAFPESIEAQEAMAISALAHRALADSDEREVATLRRFANKLKDARNYQQVKQEPET